LTVDARCGEICGVHGRVGARARRMRGRTLTGLGPELTLVNHHLVDLAVVGASPIECIDRCTAWVQGKDQCTTG
jgi:hypothetical protein